MRRDRTTDHTRGPSVLVARSKRETPTGIAGNDEDASGRPRGDPVLREFAKQSILDDHERRIDRALRALLREPLPLHIRFPRMASWKEKTECLSCLPCTMKQC